MKAPKLIFSFLFLMAVITIQAQDKYEYATVIVQNESSIKAGNIYISYEGKFEKRDFKTSEGNVMNNMTAVIEVVNKMSAEGWEVYTSGSTPVSQVIYFLKRKKN